MIMTSEVGMETEKIAVIFPGKYYSTGQRR